MIIKDLLAREILDSRGNPTVEVDLYTEEDKFFRASVPSGASTGVREALELRDKERRYNGLGVTKAVNNIINIIKPEIIGKSFTQESLDELLNKLDGTGDKSKIGANAILAVSLAYIKALSNNKIYRYLSNGEVNIPIPMMNILNGGKHANNNLDIQEFMIVPQVKTFKERLRVGKEVFYALKKLLNSKELNTNVGDEGGFAPILKNNKEALDLIMDAIEIAGYTTNEVKIAIDVAATSFYDTKSMEYIFDGKIMSSLELLEYYRSLINEYPIISIEDPFYENDFESLRKITEELGNKVMIVGDDYFVTNTRYLQEGIDKQAGNAILLKANQIGTVTEMINTINLAKKNNYQCIISHRSGETEDTFISDFAVGLCIPYIKSGSLCRGERIAKYNQLLRIEEELNS